MATPSAALSLGDAAIRLHDGLFSLNDLHAAAGGERRHRPGYFLAGGQTKALISEIETAGNPAVRTEEGANGGTYACRELVIAYAAWISAAFHLRVIRVFLAAQQQAPAIQPAPATGHPMAGKRLLVTFNQDGQPDGGRLLPDGAKMMSLEELASAISSPTGGGWAPEQLLMLAEAIHGSLAREARRLVAMRREQTHRMS